MKKVTYVGTGEYGVIRDGVARFEVEKGQTIEVNDRAVEAVAGNKDWQVGSRPAKETPKGPSGVKEPKA